MGRPGGDEGGGEELSPAAQESLRQRMEAMWRERARRLSRRSTLSGSAEDDAVPVMVLGIGQERYGIDLADVAEVFPAIRPTPVPGMAARFSGVVNVHGDIRPVIDLRRVLGIDTARAGEMARVVLLRREGQEAGLEIDSVEQIRWIGSGDLRTAGNGDEGSSGYIKGSTKDLLMLLSTEALLAELGTGAKT